MYNIENIYKIEEYYFELKNNKIEKADLLVYLLDIGFTPEPLRIINNILDDDIDFYHQFIEFQCYLIGYNLKERRRITSYEKMSVDVRSINLDDFGNVIENNNTDYDNFLIYKELFL